MTTKHVQWMDILAHPIYSENIAKYTTHQAGVKPFRTLSRACKTLYMGGRYLSLLAQAHHNPRLYPSQTYQRLAQLHPFEQRPTCLGRCHAFSASGQQSVKILDPSRLAYDNGTASEVLECKHDREVSACAIGGEITGVSRPNDKVNFVATIESKALDEYFVNLCLPRANCPPYLCYAPLLGSFRPGNMLHIFDLPETTYLLFTTNDYQDDSETVFFIDLNKHPHYFKIRPLTHEMKICQITTVTQPSLDNQTVFAFLLEQNQEDDTTSFTPKQLSVYHPVHMLREKHHKINDYTIGLAGLGDQFVVLLSHEANGTYQLQAIDTDSGALGPRRTLPRMLYQPMAVAGDVHGEPVSILPHLPFDDGPLGRQVIVSAGFEACTYLSRGLELHPLKRLTLGVDKHVVACKATHWRDSDGTMRLRFHFEDIDKDLHEHSLLLK